VDARTGLPVVGMVGAGQLARMTHQAAIALGQSLRVLAETPDDGGALVAGNVVVGDYRDPHQLRAFARGCDVVTFDHEHVPPDTLAVLHDDGVPLLPSPAALRHAQDKSVMRERLGTLGVPVPRWAMAATLSEARTFADSVGWPLVGKTPIGGYDGRGVFPLPDEAAVAGLLERGPLLLEEQVPIRRELAAVLARSPYGQAASWPVVETVQQDGICVEVLAPAPGLDDELAVHAEALALRLAAELDVVGVLAVELFETPTGLVVNELAMRPHNSAHWTIEGSRTSQFEQHLRAVLDYPLGQTELTAPAVAMANVLGGSAPPQGLDERLHHLFAADPALKVHLYGKSPRPGRKLGHVTALGNDPDEVRRRARAGARYLADGSR